MSALRRLILRLVSVFRPGGAERDLAREVRSHLALLEDEFQRRGMSRDEARLAARRAFGGVERAKDQHRDARSFRWLDDARRDVRYAVRTLWRAPTFTMVAVVTLALGIGANTAVFGILHAVVLRPLPYVEPGRLVRVHETVNGADSFLDGPGVTALRERSRTLDVAALFTYAVEGADLAAGPQAERVQVLRVSSNYFRVLGARPTLGHPFAPADERADARVAVVSARIWRAHLDAAEDAAGRSLTLDGVPYRVAAVLPDGFDDPLQPGVDVWTPLDKVAVATSDVGNFWLTALARLRPGATLEAAQAEAATLVAGATQAVSRRAGERSARVAPLQADTVGSTGRTLAVLLGGVGLLLIIACVNVASLFLARGAARRPELAIRAAIGCSRGRLVRQLLVESVILSLSGGLAGLAFAHFATRVLLAAAPEDVSRAAATTLDPAVLAFCGVVAVLAGVAFGVAPALQVTHAGLEGVLRDGRRGATVGRPQTRARSALVVCQIALALMLVIGAGLLLRSFDKLRTVALGVETAGVMTFEVNLPSTRYGDPGRRARFHRDLHEAVAALPAVRDAGAVSRLPVTGEYHSWLTRRLDRPSGSADFVADQRVVEGAYFRTLGIPLLRGRTFTPADDAGAPRRVVVSLSLARALFGDDDPLGRTLRATGDAPVCEIIGVVGDVAVSARGVIRPTVYHAHQQFAANRNWALTQVVALDRPAPTLLRDLRRVLASIDPTLVLHRPGGSGQDLQPLSAIVGSGLAHERFALLLMATFALLALVLAAVGVYGVLSYAVGCRTREMGIRMALGAPARAVRAIVVRDAGRLAAAGVLFGLAGASIATSALRSLLFDVSTRDPAVFAAAALALATVALCASWLPARAATKADPLNALQSDGQ